MSEHISLTSVNVCVLIWSCVFLQDEEVILQNPSDAPVFVQVLPLALLPNPSVFSGKLADRWQLAQLQHISITSSSCSLYVIE